MKENLSESTFPSTHRAMRSENYQKQPSCFTGSAKSSDKYEGPIDDQYILQDDDAEECLIKPVFEK